MSNTPTKVFTGRIVDECGGEFDEAVIGILDYSVTSQQTAKSEGFDSNYDKFDSIHGISYKASFYYDEEKRKAGKRSKPLLREEYVKPKPIYEKDEEGNLIRDEEGQLVLTGEMTKGEYQLRDFFEVEVNNIEVNGILKSDLEYDSKVLRAIQMDIAVRFRK